MKRIPGELIDFMRDNAPGIMAKELALLVNAAFGTCYTDAQIKTIKSNHGIRCGRKPGIPAGIPTKAYPKEIRDYIYSNFPGVGPTEMSERLNRSFGTSYSVRQLNTYYKNHKLNSGVTGRFEIGHVSANKGKKGYCSPGCERTWFIKGHIPQNHKPVGSERIDVKDGYVLVKTAEPHVWRLKHRIIWESINGPIPEDCMIIFVDGNRLNTDISNLRLITRAENAVMNKKGLRGGSAELLETGLLITKAARMIYQKEHRKRGTTDERRTC